MRTARPLLTVALPVFLLSTLYTAAAVKLPPVAEEVLALSRAGITDVVILTYIDSSGRIYDLRPDQIVYLRDQGVSDTVVKAMLEQKKLATTTPVETTPSAPSAPVAPADSTYSSCPIACMWCGGPLYADVQPIPMSTLHIIPYRPGAITYFGRACSFWPPPSRTFGPYHVFDTTRTAWNYQRWMEPFPCGHWHYCPIHYGYGWL